jgi:carbon monoxide dehydrogenase subunit G
MIDFESSVLINRPQQEVFDFLTNPANDAKWQSGTELAEWTSEAPHGVGSTQRSVGKLLGRKIDIAIEVTNWDPPQQMGFKTVGGPLSVEGTIKLESQENGTLLTQSGQGEFGGFFKIAEGLAAKQLQKQVDTDFDALKLVLEEGQA